MTRRWCSVAGWYESALASKIPQFWPWTLRSVLCPLRTLRWFAHSWASKSWSTVTTVTHHKTTANPSDHTLQCIVWKLMSPTIHWPPPPNVKEIQQGNPQDVLRSGICCGALPNIVTGCHRSPAAHVGKISQDYSHHLYRRWTQRREFFFVTGLPNCQKYFCRNTFVGHFGKLAIGKWVRSTDLCPALLSSFQENFPKIFFALAKFIPKIFIPGIKYI